MKAVFSTSPYKDGLVKDLPKDLSLTQLDELLDSFGIASGYTEFSGEFARISRENRLGVLAALGVTVQSGSQLDELLRRRKMARLEQLLAEVQIIHQGQRDITIHLDANELPEKIQWHLRLENGESRTGDLVPADMQTVFTQELYERRFVGKKMVLGDIPFGYHQLKLDIKNSGEHDALLVASPVGTYQPPWLREGKKIWGLSVQLYTIRSASDWGIGDFSDLYTLTGLARQQGADFILLNPLHALDIMQPERASPYSPIDRRFMNPLYVAPQWCEGFDPEEARAWLDEMGLQKILYSCKASALVDYSAVFSLKIQLFARLFKKFRRQHLLKRTMLAKEFRRFVKNSGEVLQGFVAYQAAQKIPDLRLRGKKDFYAYLQWQARRQFKRCQDFSLQQGMRLGLVNDFAVGSVIDGYEVRSAGDLFATSARIGAPPDNFNPDGQNWGLPPVNPEKLQQSRYAHFIELLRDNMKNCGALRIDHVMSLMRLWWCLDSGSPAFDKGAGAYVYYPVDELFAILRLESDRAKCMVIGEDLGVVPPEIREYLDSAGILSNLVFYFEKYDGWHFRKPEHFKTHALTMITNHDVPTLCAWWNKSDLGLRRSIGLISSDEKLAAEHVYRDGEKQQLLNWLEDLQLLPQQWRGQSIEKSYDYFLGAALAKGCALSNSVLISIQLDDLVGLELPVNIPGTHREYANWRRKIPLEPDALFSQEGAQLILNSLRQGRDSW